ncbi:MAG: NUDIX hydrolase [Anaerolineales bacterium]
MDKRETVFQTEWFSIEQESFDQVETLGGKPYYRINSPDGVIILALTKSDQIILVRQFRPAFNQNTLEFPSGAIDDSESPQEAAARELHEETGYVCQDLNPLGVGRIMMNRHSCREYAFLGSGAVKAPGLRGNGDIDVVLASPADFRALVLSGKFEQFAGLALFVLADWKLGRQFAGQS